MSGPAVAKRIASLQTVHVKVDESGKEPVTVQIEHRVTRAARDRPVAHVDDAVAVDHDRGA